MSLIAPTIAVAMKLINANHPATLRKFFRVIRQIPRSSSGGLSCLGLRLSNVAGLTLCAVLAGGALPLLFTPAAGNGR